MIADNMQIIDTLDKIQTNFSLIEKQTSLNMKALSELKTAIDKNRKYSQNISENELARSEILKRNRINV